MTALGADWWNDSGVPDELGEAVALGAVGGTSNPVIVSQAVKSQPAHCNAVIDRLIAENPNDTEDDLAWKLIHTLAIDAASRLKPVYDRTRGAKGFLSVQVNPKYYRNKDG
jgi:transaldolase